jgi:nitrogen-specific signal transduction histidine kinase/ActR/RegA family two-component response regulator
VLRAVAGPPEKLFGTFQDITERKGMEEELLKGSKLESLGVLAGGIAHDFNNLLTAIIGNLSLVQRAVGLESRVRQRLTEVERAADRATALTQQLLTFSKGGAPIKRMASIAEMLRESATFTLRGSNVRCTFIIPADLWTAEVDVGQMDRVLHNLVLNGAQAMPEGGVMAITAENLTLQASAGLPLRPGKYLKLTIADHGSGIAAEHLPKIFDPYFTTKATGNGLGLAAAYSIIKRHDGHITVASQRGVGTTFQVYLPAALTSYTPLAEHGPHLYTGIGKILVMDDEAVLRDLARQMLQYLGYAVEVTRDGDEALTQYRLAIAAGAPFDAVLLDLTIPGGMGGKETMQRLREIDPAVRAIVASGYSNDPCMADFSVYGFCGVVAKPYRLEDLSRTLNSVLKAQAPHRDVRV